MSEEIKPNTKYKVVKIPKKEVPEMATPDWKDFIRGTITTRVDEDGDLGLVVPQEDNTVNILLAALRTLKGKKLHAIGDEDEEELEKYPTPKCDVYIDETTHNFSTEDDVTNVHIGGYNNLFENKHMIIWATEEEDMGDSCVFIEWKKRD